MDYSGMDDPRIPSYEITDYETFKARRKFIKQLGLASLSLAAVPFLSSNLVFAKEQSHYSKANIAHWQGSKSYPSVQVDSKAPLWLREKVSKRYKAASKINDTITPYEAATTYNNFYELGSQKHDPFRNAGQLITDPWKIRISGEVEKEGTFDLDDILSTQDIEERIYRFRCVEGWSMVVPWLGFPLSSLLNRFNPTKKAKFVQFTSVYDPKNLSAQNSFFSSIEWPYVEGLRIDEAYHPLTILAVGMYGHILPNQNGAPLRLIVPWKYGFKSIKSIVDIRLTSDQPLTTWVKTAPKEYGFYANVNPEVDHPRWSQKAERRLPVKLFGTEIIPTLKFNGYQKQVAHLYEGMNLRHYY